MSKASRAIQIAKEEDYGELTNSVKQYFDNRSYRDVMHKVRDSLRYALSPESGENAVRNRFKDISRLIDRSDPVIVDGGAHVGQTVRQFQSMFDEPTIHAVEANPLLCERIRKQNSKNENVYVHEYALGKENTTVDLNINTDEATSSVLQATDENKSRHGNRVQTQKTVCVEQTRLDSLLPNSPDILKLDLQGYELPALRGATDYLADIELITTEIQFMRMYEGQSSYYEIMEYLENNGFRIFNTYDVYSQEDGRITQADVIYLNSEDLETN